jgi:hypothetical protein
MTCLDGSFAKPSVGSLAATKIGYFRLITSVRTSASIPITCAQFKAMAKCSGDELSRGGGFAESPSRYEKARDQSARSRAVIERLPAL